MLTTIAYVLAGLAGAAICFVGVHDLLAPQKAAAGFGLPEGTGESPTSHGWMSARAVRDIASGLFIFILLANGKPHVLGWIMLAACLIPLGDAWVVLRNKGPKSAVYGVHGGTVVLMLVITGMLLGS
ncbi:DUF4267 domain-containing protein [Streptomyces sp. NPDC093109]|uniref:DUF4267 domain-containing protein n=1 Tax=Streptomyces sp. NPDC093109 TaxID=3154977 RepID=UPI00344B5ACC